MKRRLDVLVGRIVFDDFEDVYVMRVEGNDVRALTRTGASVARRRGRES